MASNVSVGVLYSCFDKLGNKEVEQDLQNFGISAHRSLSQHGHTPTLINLDDTNFQAIQQKGFDIIFNVCERFKGVDKEPHIASALEVLGLNITGSPGRTIGLCNNKAMVKKIALENGVSTPAYFVMHSEDQDVPEDFVFPAVVKPTSMHNSIGIYKNAIAYTASQAKRKAKRVISEYGQPALIEQFIPGKDIEISILGNNNTLVALPMEVYYPKNREDDDPLLFSYESKWYKQSSRYGDYRPVTGVSDYKLKEIIKTAKKCYKLFGLRDYGRIDFRLNEKGKFYLIEINVNPGLNEENSTIRAAQCLGIDQPTIIHEIFRIAASRCGVMKPKKILA